MKLFLEQETGVGEARTISKIKEVSGKAEAVTDKTLNKCFLHTCFHDEKKQKPCKREVI